MCAMKEFKDNSDELFKDNDQPTEAPLEEAEPIESEGVSELQAERDELFDRLQRVSADYANAVKRHQQQLNDQVTFAKGDLLRAFLPVLDHFDNALAAPPESDEAKALHQGVVIVRDELLKVLQQAGVEEIAVEAGTPFDPAQHEAMFPQTAEGIEPNHVSMVLQPGYRLGERTLRAAKVAVAPDQPIDDSGEKESEDADV